MIRWLAVVVALLGLAMLTNDSFRERAIMRKVSERVEGTDRYVDIGVTLHTVVADPNGDEILSGRPKLRIVGTTHHGGIIDTNASPPRIIGPSRDPRVWYCSEEQRAVIIANDKQPAQLVYGSEGAGKTTALAMWHYFRWVQNLGHYREGGQTAPTNERLGAVKAEMEKLYGANWMRWRELTDFTGFEFCDRTRIRFRYTHRRSAAEGEPIQTYNWCWCGRDEMQDQIEAHAGIQARGRSAPNGVYRQLGTATAKDSPEWRDFRDGLESSGLWIRRTLLGVKSPFVWPAHWESMKASMSSREYRRRVWAEDLAPESRVYYNWDRAKNLRQIPRVGARKITSIVLSRKTGDPRHSLLIGHDPGTAKAASIFLDVYDVLGEVCWWVRAELFTFHKGSEEHAREALEISQKQFGTNTQPGGAIAHVRAQPVGQAVDKPDQDVYRIWTRVGFHIKAAQFKKDGTGTGVIGIDTRIEMVNRLLGDSNNPPRLFVDFDEHGKPVAPKLVAAFETMERDHKGRAEQEAKDEKDPTDAPCALGYGLWPWEKEAATALRAEVRKGIS